MTNRHRIWKFPLAIEDVQTLEMPCGYTLLSIQEQANAPCVWAMVETNAPMTPVTFYVVGTGNPLPWAHPERPEFLATVQTHGGRLVWHIFREKRDDRWS